MYQIPGSAMWTCMMRCGLRLGPWRPLSSCLPLFLAPPHPLGSLSLSPSPSPSPHLSPPFRVPLPCPGAAGGGGEQHGGAERRGPQEHQLPGVDNKTYYLTDDAGAQVVPDCGAPNAFNCNHPVVHTLVRRTHPGTPCTHLSTPHTPWYAAHTVERRTHPGTPHTAMLYSTHRARPTPSTATTRRAHPGTACQRWTMEWTVLKDGLYSTEGWKLRIVGWEGQCWRIN